MQRLASIVATLSVTALTASIHAGDTLSIRDLAPDTALLVVGADDVRGTIDRLGPTAYGKLWNDPAIAEEVKKFRGQFEESLKKASAEAGIEGDTVTWPSSLGLAVMAEVDEELGLPSTQFIFFCDWSKEAETTSKMIDALIADIEKKAKDDSLTLKYEEVRGRKAVGVPLAAADAPAEGEDGGDEMMDDPFGAGPDFGPKEAYLVSDKGRLFAASSVAALDMLLARVDGERTKSAGDSETFKGAAELAGGTQDVYAVLSTEAAGPILNTMPQFMLARPLVARFFGDIKAWSFGLHAKDGVIELGQGIYVPGGKVGLLSLADLATEPSAPPAIVPADAISYGRMNLRFDKLMAMLDEAIGGMPPEQGEMIGQQLELYRPAMTAAFGAMGPEMHMWSTAPKADDPMSGSTVTAIKVKSDKDSSQAVMDFISQLPLGLQSRDFNGMTIMSDEFAPVAIGVGGGYVVLGSVESVEQTLRAVDAKGEAGLAGDADFTRSFGLVGKAPTVGYAWWNTAKQMESQQRMVQMMAAQVEGMAGDGEGAEVPGVDVGLDDLVGFWDLMKPEVVKRCFGDSILEFKGPNAGFSTMYRVHPGGQS